MDGQYSLSGDDEATTLVRAGIAKWTWWAELTFHGYDSACDHWHFCRHFCW